MNMSTRVSRLFKQQSLEQSAQSEADRLLGLLGETACDVARNLSVREGAGLLHTSTPNFWARVGHEIGHRIGMPEGPTFGSNLLVP